MPPADPVTLENAVRALPGDGAQRREHQFLSGRDAQLGRRLVGIAQALLGRLDRSS
ncbi:MAG TPA: hypothetical protein VFY45_25290 [Baekduia sp.]|jgi:hypothetical protein|nr:hypothetical protein [Baekduia sp.]